MSRTEQNYWLDMILNGVFVITNLTGCVLWLVVPGKVGAVFFGFARSGWVTAHAGFGAAGLAGVVLHIAWHRSWLKALRGRALQEMPEKVRAKRVVDRNLWIAYLATIVCGAAAGGLHLGGGMDLVSVPDRLHVAFGIVWTLLMMVHLALHWKWIAATTRHAVQVHLRAGLS